MKNKVKLYVSIVLIMLASIFIFNTENIFGNTFYGDRTSDLNFKTDYLDFKEVKFIDNSNNSSLSFGITGKVKNISKDSVTFNADVYYYDSNSNLIATSTKTMQVPSNYVLDVVYTQMSAISIIPDGYSVTDVTKYKIVIGEKYTTGFVDTDSNKNNNINDYVNNDSYTDNKLSSFIEEYEYEDYVIESYDVEINVNENNTFNITEKITAYFNVDKHGILRQIPLSNTIIRNDGTTSKNTAQISNVEVIGDKFITGKEFGDYIIKIGSTTKTLTGKKEYTIKYTYNIGKDPVDVYDELYYNIIGTKWDTVIGNVTFKVNMPKEFDASKLGFSVGSIGSTNSDNIIYDVKGNVITGSYEDVLNPGEGLTVRLELDEGYFVGARNKIDEDIYFMCGLPIIFVIISLLLWIKYGRDNRVVETVEFYPPEEFNSLEVGYFYKGKADNNDVISLLIYLANKGYIRIDEVEEGVLFDKSKGYKITKLKEYDGNNESERLFLNGLFLSKYQNIGGTLFGKDQEVNVNEVRLSDLQNKFYTTINKILTLINNKANKHSIFEKTSLMKKMIVIAMMIITFILISIRPLSEYGEENALIVGILFPGIGFAVLSAMLFNKNSLYTKIFSLIWGSFFGGVPWILMVYPAIIPNETYLFEYIFGIICIFIMCVINGIMPKRTAYGNEILGRIEGFKKFLITAEKARLESLVMENPTYFYDILPYAYVLGVSDKWIKKFEVIGIEEARWYSGFSTFSVSEFGKSITKTMSTANAHMTSSPASSSSGGSSGGGSSGGGSGGGGGSSW